MASTAIEINISSTDMIRATTQPPRYVMLFFFN